MSVRTDQVNLFVNVNSNKAQNELNDLRKKAAETKAEMEGLKKGTEAYVAKKKELGELTAKMDDLKKEIGLTALSQKELVAELNKLKALKGSVVPFSQEFKDLQKQIELVEDRLYDVKNGVTGFSSFISKIKDEVKQFGVMAAAYLGFEFITDQFQSMLSGSGKLSDQLADVRKNTGLTAEQVDGLNSSIKKIDTRTANTQLRDLAIDAGKLGIQGRDAIMEFVEAGDQVRVALGEDLGDNAVQDLGKLVDIFRLKEDFGLKDSMLKVGSAINDVGASSAATEGYIVDFLKRMGGIGPSAKIAIPDLIGLAGTLDSLGQTSESSTTAIGNTLSKLVTDFDGFAKIAGISGEKLKAIFNEKGGLEALKAVLKGVKDSGGNFDDLIAKLGDVGIEGSKAKGVFAILTNNLDMLSNQQKIANESFAKGISLTDEFNIKNQTFGATLDKLGKEFNSLLTSSAVTGFLESAVNGAVKFIQVLKDLPRLISENRTLLVFLAGVVLSYAATIKNGIVQMTLFRGQYALLIIQQKLSAFWTGVVTTTTRAYTIAKRVLAGEIALATIKQHLWNLALKANPLALIFTGVTLLATGIAHLTKKISDETAAEKTRNEIRKQAADGYATEEAKIRSLAAVLTNNTVSLEARKKALQELIAINPAYLGGLTLENAKTAEGKKLIDDYVKSLRIKAETEAATSLEAEQIKQLEELAIKRRESAEEIKETYGFDQNLMEQTLATYQAGYDKQEAAIRKKMQTIEEVITQTFQQSVGNISKGTNAQVVEGGNVITRTLSMIEEKLKPFADRVKGFFDKLSGAAGTDGKKSLRRNVNARIAEIDAEMSRLKDKYGEMDTTNIKGLAANRMQRDRLENEKRSLLGEKPLNTGSNNKGTDDSKREYERLKKEATKFAADIEQLNKKVQRGELDENSKEVQAVQDKYAELSAKALDYYTKLTHNANSSQRERLQFKKNYDAEEIALEKLKQQEINQVLEKFFEKRTIGEYEESLANSAEFFEAQKQQTARAYGEGRIDKKHYEESIRDIEHRESSNRILIAQDYSATVKKAAEDVTKFKLQQEKEVTANLISESEKRRAFEEREREAQLQRLIRTKTNKDGSDTDASVEARKRLLAAKFIVDVAGLSAESEQYKNAYEQLQKDIEDIDEGRWKRRLEKVQEYVGYFQTALDGLNQVIANNETRQLAKDKKNSEAQKKNLKKQLDDKLISQTQYDKKVQAMDEEMDRKEKELQRKQAEREKALNLFNAVVATASAVAEALPNIPLSIAAGVLGAIQIASIASQPLPELGTGDWLRTGPKHRETGKGTVVMIERDEAVMAAAAMTDPNTYTVTGTTAQITSALNSKNGGVDWAGGAVIDMPAWRRERPAGINPNLPQMMGEGGMVRQMAQAASFKGNTSSEFTELKAEMQGFREDVKTWNTNLKAYTVLKEQDDVRKLYDDSKKAAGVRQ